MNIPVALHPIATSNSRCHRNKIHHALPLQKNNIIGHDNNLINAGGIVRQIVDHLSPLITIIC